MASDVEISRFAEHRNAFGFLRLLFATLVIVSHTPELADGNDRRELLVQLFGTLSFGALAVDGFFLISGYLIVGSWIKRPAPWPYLKKRVVRIYPAFIVASLVAVLIVAPLGGAAGGAVLHAFGSSLRKMIILQPPVVIGAFADTPQPALNGSTWTIAIEFRCYLLVLALGVSGAFRYRSLILALAIVALAAFELVPPWIWRTYFDPLPYSVAWMDRIDKTLRLTGLYLAGGCFWLWRDAIRFHAVGGWIAAGGLVACMFSPMLAEPGIATFGAYLLFGFAQSRRSGFISQVNNRTDISYGVYLYAWPIEKLLLWFWPHTPLFLVGLETMIGALVCGWLSWHVVEEPLMRRVR